MMYREVRGVPGAFRLGHRNNATFPPPLDLGMQAMQHEELDVRLVGFGDARGRGGTALRKAEKKSSRSISSQRLQRPKLVIYESLR